MSKAYTYLLLNAFHLTLLQCFLNAILGIPSLPASDGESAYTPPQQRAVCYCPSAAMPNQNGYTFTTPSSRPAAAVSPSVYSTPSPVYPAVTSPLGYDDSGSQEDAPPSLPTSVYDKGRTSHPNPLSTTSNGYQRHGPETTSDAVASPASSYGGNTETSNSGLGNPRADVNGGQPVASTASSNGEQPLASTASSNGGQPVASTASSNGGQPVASTASSNGALSQPSVSNQDPSPAPLPLPPANGLPVNNQGPPGNPVALTHDPSSSPALPRTTWKYPTDKAIQEFARNIWSMGTSEKKAISPHALYYFYGHLLSILKPGSRSANVLKNMLLHTKDDFDPQVVIHTLNTNNALGISSHHFFYVPDGFLPSEEVVKNVRDTTGWLVVKQQDELLQFLEPYIQTQFQVASPLITSVTPTLINTVGFYFPWFYKFNTIELNKYVDDSLKSISYIETRGMIRMKNIKGDYTVVKLDFMDLSTSGTPTENFSAYLIQHENSEGTRNFKWDEKWKEVLRDVQQAQPQSLHLQFPRFFLKEDFVFEQKPDGTQTFVRREDFPQFPNLQSIRLQQSTIVCADESLNGPTAMVSDQPDNTLTFNFPFRYVIADKHQVPYFVGEVTENNHLPSSVSCAKPF